MQARRVGGAECSARRTAKRDFLWTGDGAPAGSGPGSPCAARSVARGGRRELHSPHLRAYICDNPDGNLEKASSVCTCNEDRRLFLKLNTCVCMVFLGARLARQQSRSGGISGTGPWTIVHGAGGQDESSNRRVRQVALAQPRAHVALRVRRRQTADEHASRPRAPSLDPSGGRATEGRFHSKQPRRANHSPHLETSTHPHVHVYSKTTWYVRYAISKPHSTQRHHKGAGGAASWETHTHAHTNRT